MRIKYNGNIIVLYDSIADLPIVRYRDFNKFLLMDAGIGSDMEDVMKHTSTMEKYAVSKQFEKLVKEFTNFRQNLIFLINGVSPKNSCFACLVKSINGDAYPDELTQDDIDSIISELSNTRITYKKIAATVSEIKKKFDNQFETYFPDISSDPSLLDYYTKLKKYGLTVLDSIINSEVNVEEDIDKLEGALFETYEPKIFSGSDGVEVSHVMNFNDSVLALSQRFNKDPESLTTLKYYQLVELVKLQDKQNKKKHGSN